MSDMKFNGGLVKEFREQLGLTQQDLAAAVGITQGLISSYENGTKAPSVQILPVLAAALRASIDELFSQQEGDE